MSSGTIVDVIHGKNLKSSCKSPPPPVSMLDGPASRLNDSKYLHQQ